MRDDVMPDDEMEEWTESVARPLRAPESLADDFETRLMAAVRRESRLIPLTVERHHERVDAPRARRTAQRVHTSPLAGLALAAGLATVVFLGASTLRRARGIIGHPMPVRPAQVAAAAAPAPLAHRDTVFVTRFVLIAPNASTVALVGDFNSWDSSATKLRPTHGGAWTVSVSLPRGRHEYAFLVDGRRWQVDPLAPLTRDDEFGVQSSIINIGSST